MKSSFQSSFHFIFKHPRFVSGFSHFTRRRIHIGPPVLPCGLCIDRDKPLANTVPSYTDHIVITTGRDDWASRIESEPVPNLAKGLKELLGPNGEFHHPDHRFLITNSSFRSNYEDGFEDKYLTSAYLFPSFRYIRNIENTQAGYRALAEQLVPPASSPISTPGNSSPRSATNIIFDWMTDLVVLICGHGTRDQRCGVYGPILRDQFKLHLPSTRSDPPCASRTALISHIGGHAFAGNVIIYIPPAYTPPQTNEGHEGEGQVNTLGGSGIWYGRVEPDAVRDIVRETIVGGRIIEPLFRGGIDRSGMPLRPAGLSKNGGEMRV